MRTFTNRITIMALGILLITFNISCEEPDDDNTEVNNLNKVTTTTNNNIKVYSKTLTISSWSYESPYHYAELSVPELTENNIDSNGVMAYFSVDGISWRALPYTQYNSPINYYMGFISSIGNVRITWVYNSSLGTGEDPNEYYATNIKCKIVIIPTAAKILKPNVNYRNYPEVKEAFSLPN